MEIYTLTIRFPHNQYSEDDMEWSRTIEAREDYSLLKLHNYIQDIIEFDNDHLYEFYIGKNPRNRIQSLPNKIKLNEIYPLPGLKLYYLFDFGDNWLFEIIKSKKIKDAALGVTLPSLIEAIGENPVQYPDCEEQ